MHVRTVRTRRPCRAATAVASLIAASGAASAADRDWNGPPNADWNTPGFWSPAALPNAADTAWIGRLTQNSVVRITVPPQIGDLRISNGMIVEGFGGSLDVQDDVFVSGSNMVGDNRFRSQLRVKPAGVSAISVDVGDALSISDGGQIRLLGGSSASTGCSAPPPTASSPAAARSASARTPRSPLASPPRSTPTPPAAS